MQVADFHYELPDELIARHPLKNRVDSRLLMLDGATGVLKDGQFRDIEALLGPDDLLVFNDTRVIPARLYGVKQSGGKVEILIERLLAPRRALVQARANRPLRQGMAVRVGDTTLHIMGRRGDLFELESADSDFSELMEREGHVPLPPYIDRPDTKLDRERYQTVYASRPGAVAAPTAGLHFDRPMLERLRSKGVHMGTATLHVGAGTFQPVRVRQLKDHLMHSEYLEVDERLVEQVSAAKARGGRVVAVGTTSVRCLETASAAGTLRPFRGDTRLFIYPGYRFRVVDALLTNFHLPESTLLMLVCAFAGYAETMAAYRHAVAARYRFFSYGDAMFATLRTQCKPTPGR